MLSLKPARAASCQELLAAAIARPIACRFGSWDATIHLHVLGEGAFTLRAHAGRAALSAGLRGAPSCVWVTSREALADVYRGAGFARRLLAGFRERRALATSFEDVIMFAKCFDHAAVPPAGALAAPTAPRSRQLGEAARSVAADLLARRSELFADAAARAQDLADYHTGRVAVGARDLSRFGWLVSTPSGLYAVDEDSCARVLAGTIYGVAVADHAIYAFQANDHWLRPTRRGRIVRLEHRAGRIARVEVVARGLENACHQIALAGGRLLVCDTARDRIVELDEGFAVAEEHAPAGTGHSRTESPHLNSVLAVGARRHVMCHNSTEWTGRPSEVLECDEAFRPLGRTALAGGACHSLARLGDGWACCLSERGEVVAGGDGRTLAQIDPGLFARGLAIDAERLVVGGSELPHRSHRRLSRGRIFFFDRDGSRRAVLPVPGAPREVRSLPWRPR